MIEFRGVSKTYPGSERPLFHDLSFEVLDGALCVLVGPSGCGTPTSLRLINRLLEPSSGALLLDGERPPAMSGTRLTLGRANV